METNYYNVISNMIRSAKEKTLKTSKDAISIHAAYEINTFYYHHKDEFERFQLRSTLLKYDAGSDGTLASQILYHLKKSAFDNQSF